MSKLGNRSFPGDLDPDEAERWMTILVNEFNGKAESKEAFAQAVGHKSTNSGSFRRKLADARKYNLMTPRGEFEATELGMQLANPRDEQERYETRLEMLKEVPILREIHSTLNGNKPDDFWRVLTEITDANPKEAQDAAEWLEHLYDDILKAEKVAQGGVEPEEIESVEETDSEQETQSSRSSSATDSAQGRTSKKEDSAIYLRIENDELRFEELTDANLEIAKQFLDSKKGDEGVQMRLG